MINIKHIYIASSFIAFISCTQIPPYQVVTTTGNPQVSVPAKDCNGYVTEMKIMYGYNSPSSGATFARLLAVDHLDGTMSIAILPPSGATSFPFPESKLNKSFKLIACPENGFSALSPLNALGACKSAPINLIGGNDKLNPVSNFTEKGVIINGTRVHATRNPGTDEGKFLPNFIMLITTKSNDNDNIDNDLIIATGELPYKLCYTSKTATY